MTLPITNISEYFRVSFSEYNHANENIYPEMNIRAVRCLTSQTQHESDKMINVNIYSSYVFSFSSVMSMVMHRGNISFNILYI